MANCSYVQERLVVRKMSGDKVLSLSMDETLGITVAMLKGSLARLTNTDVWNFDLVIENRILNRKEFLHDICVSSPCYEILIVTREEFTEEDLESLSDDEKACDSLMNVRVRKELGTAVFFGHVENIMISSMSRQLLYFVRYSSGDSEHVTREHVEDMLFAESANHFQELSLYEKNADPLMGSKVRKIVSDTQFRGYIDNIGIGSVSQERLYRVHYLVGHTEYVIAGQISNMVFAESSDEDIFEDTQ
eukprot:12431452-Karenia_brevis.AAC.3